MLVRTRSVCGTIPPSTSWPVAGSNGICPEMNSSSPARMAWEYGPIACGAWGVLTAVCGTSGGLDDFVRAEATRADAQALRAAIDDRADRLQVRIEAARRHVVRVADVAAEGRLLPADFASLGHDTFSAC